MRTFKPEVDGHYCFDTCEICQSCKSEKYVDRYNSKKYVDRYNRDYVDNYVLSLEKEARVQRFMSSWKWYIPIIVFAAYIIIRALI